MTDAIVKDLCSWLKENDVDLGSDESLSLIQSENSCEGRCVISKKDYQSDSTILEFPLKFQINYRHAFKSNILIEFFNWYAEKIVLEDQNLRLNRLDGLYLFMIEQTITQNSFFSKFINSLPKNYDTPEYFDQSIIDSFPDCFKSKFLKRFQKLDLKFEFISNLLQRFEKSSHDRQIQNLCQNFTRDNFRWIFCSVNSRCFHAKESEVCDKKEITLANRFFGRIKESEGELKRAIKCSSLSEYEKCLDTSEEIRNNLCCLIPYLDFLNHSNKPNAFAEFDKKTKVFSLKSIPCEESGSVVIRKGDQVYITYGPHDNLTLLIEYGFIIKDNIYDKLTFSFDLFKQLIEADQSTENFIWNCCIQQNLLSDLTCNKLEGPSWCLLKCLDLISGFNKTKNQSSPKKIKFCANDFYEINNYTEIKNLFLKLLENFRVDFENSLQKLNDLNENIKKSYHFKMSFEMIQCYKEIVEFNLALVNDQEKWAMLF